VDLQTHEGETSLMAAISSEQVEGVASLLSFHASLDVGDDQLGLGPLHLAASIGNVAILELILAQEECDVNKVGLLLF
jgi:ankyrin repeat protein